MAKRQFNQKWDNDEPIRIKKLKPIKKEKYKTKRLTLSRLNDNEY